MSLRDASDSELRRVSGGWLRGFRPIYQKELAYWFGTHRWISQLIIWMSLTAVPAIWMTPSSANDRGVSYLTLFLWLGGILLSIGTITLAQGTIIEEKLTQTLLWICSKPLSRAAFILAKFAAHAVLIGGIALGVPAIFTYIAAMMVGLPSSISLPNYLVAVGMVYTILMFILALTLMIGTFFNRVGAVTAIALFVFFGGASLSANPHLRQIEPYTVWALQRDAAKTAVGEFSSEAWIAVSSTIVLTGLCLAVAVWRMEQHEL
ncbi:ABC transporter permease [Phormidesmis priestleyi]